MTSAVVRLAELHEAEAAVRSSRGRPKDDLEIEVRRLGTPRCADVRLRGGGGGSRERREQREELEQTHSSSFRTSEASVPEGGYRPVTIEAAWSSAYSDRSRCGSVAAYCT